MITAELIKELRDKTGVSMMQCKQALEESHGEIDGALVYLKKKGIEIAAKKADRELKSGVVQSYVHSNNSVGAMIELNCETDFVARNEEFKTLAYDLAMHVVAMNPTYLNDEAVTEDVKKETAQMFAKEVEDMNKPEEMKAKILEGKVSSFLGDKTLSRQSFVKGDGETVADLVKSRIQKFGEKIEIRRFIRFSLLDK